MLRMQRKSMGHSRRKQGAQGTSPTMAPRGGPVSSGEVLPNGTITGTPTAAARCMGPVSFVRTALQQRNRAQSSRSVVLPARSITGPEHPAAICAVRGASFAPPKRIQPQLSFVCKRFAASTNRSIGQRFAGPYSAPGFKPRQTPAFGRRFLARITSSSVTCRCGGIQCASIKRK